MRIAEPFDVIIDATDNFPTRYLTNDLCVLTGKPNIYGAIYRFEGQASVFYAKARTLLPLPVSRTASAWDGALLRGRWRVGYPARDDRHDPGH